MLAESDAQLSQAPAQAVDAASPEAQHALASGEALDAQAALRRPGSDVTILSWLLMLHFSLDAAQQLAKEGIAAYTEKRKGNFAGK